MNLSRLFCVAGAVILASFVSGCAHLGVEVDILDSNFWLSPEWLVHDRAAQIQRSYYKVQDGTLDRERDELEITVKAVLEGMSKGDNATIATPTLPQIIADFNGTIDTAFTAAKSSFASAYDTLLTPPPCKHTDADMINTAWKVYQPAAEELSKLPDKLSRDLRERIPKSATAAVQETATKQASNLAQQIQKAVQGIIGDHGVFNDPFASVVVTAPERYWKGQFNKTYGCGTFGNLDIAIKMEDVANFTIKGVRNDAAAITRATFAVGQQAVQSVAAIYGIPLPKPTPSQPASDGKAATTIDAPTFDSPRVRVALATARENDLRRARASLFEALIAQRAALAADKERAQAIQALKDAVSNYGVAIKDDTSK